MKGRGFSPESAESPRGRHNRNIPIIEDPFGKNELPQGLKPRIRVSLRPD
jgi:hypothetical protein